MNDNEILIDEIKNPIFLEIVDELISMTSGKKIPKNVLENKLNI